MFRVSDRPLKHHGFPRYPVLHPTNFLLARGRAPARILDNSHIPDRAAPRIEHMDRMKHLYGYAKHFQDGAIKVRTGIPDDSELKGEEHDWLNSIYENIDEELHQDIPTPLGQMVRISAIFDAIFDANLYHDLITERGMTGVLMFVIKTPVDWYSKNKVLLLLQREPQSSSQVVL